MNKLNYAVSFFLVVLMVAVGLQHFARWQQLTGTVRRQKTQGGIFPGVFRRVSSDVIITGVE
jgi:hypothetical protein